MGRAALCMRAAALLAAAGMFIFLAEGISADNDIAEAVTARVLEPTELVAEIPEGYGTLFQIQWGGGSLPQLRGRLAGRGCALNTLWVYGEDGWHGYNRYDLPQEFSLNQQFIERYEQDVPAGTLYATCADQPVAQDLQPTQIVADIPEKYDTVFNLQWGGGSLFQLKGRLATTGCMVNNISYTDPETNREYTYNQYTTRSPERANKQFLQRYEHFIPASELSADCYEVCQFWGIPAWCAPFEERRANYDGGNFSSIKHSTCTDDFLPQVKEVVFSLLPMRPNVCVVRDFTQDIDYIGGYALVNNVAQPFIFINGTDPTNDAYLTRSALNTEIHELCHINQHWHWAQQISRGNSVGYNNTSYFNNSKHGKEFIELIGFTAVSDNAPRADLPYNSIYRDIYSLDPIELSAELCKMYLTEKMGLESIYEYRTYDYPNRNITNDYIRHPRREVDVNKYLTPEVREWLETYMILPDVSE